MKYKLNDIIDVTVSSIVPYGVFVDADYGFTGLIHISEITGGYIKNISKYFKKGNIVTVKIIGIDEEKKQLSLSTKDVIMDSIFNKENSLKEEGMGFQELKDRLPEWIDFTKKELENNK